MEQPSEIASIITDSAQLVELTAELEKRAGLVPDLQKQAAAASAQVARLTKQAADFSASVREKAGQCADFLESRGLNIKKAEFVEALVNDPLSVFGVITKIASEISVPQLGAGDPAVNMDTAIVTDPIVAWAQGGNSQE